MKMAVVIPLGPRLNCDFVSDTIESIRHYCDPTSAIVGVDDSGTERIGDLLLRRYPTLEVVRTGRQQPSGGRGALFLAVCLGLNRALELGADVVLRLDADALVIGHAPEDDALNYFLEHPAVGLLGSYRFSCTGQSRDSSWAKRQLVREVGPQGWHDPRRALMLGRQLLRARRYGYQMGEHALAAATFVSARCLGALRDLGYLDTEALRTSRVTEDSLLGLAVRAAGFELGDFAIDPYPVGVAWRGLPMPPAELLQHGKKVIHSVKNDPEASEEDLRSYFSMKRK